MSKVGMKDATVRPNVIPDDGGSPPPEKLVCAFNELRDELVSTLWYLLGSQEDAQDAAQEAFLKCWRNQGSLKDVRNMRAWVFRVALNVARDQQRSAWYRRSKQFNGEDALIAQRGTGPEVAIENQESLDQVRTAIMHLRQDEKEVFLMRQNGNLTFEQIAEIRRSPLGTVKTQMRSALHKLRQKLTVSADSL
jgi:RNA polymerase sigma-70 factor, ECF subfamily